MLENVLGDEYYYIIGDIHGHLTLLQQTLNKINLKLDFNGKLIFLGDYIDGGKNSSEVLYMIQNLVKMYKDKVIVLRGNHEESFLEWLNNPVDYIHYFIEDQNFNTLKTFFTEEEFDYISNKIDWHENVQQMSVYFAKIIKEKHKDLVTWLKKLPYYYETEKQIFVHAGIDEDAEELWKVGTPKEYFTSKFPPTTGKFYKDIIAGHVGISNFKNTKMKDIYYDGNSYYYIDGVDGNENKTIPILCYDIKNNRYFVI